MTNKRTKVPSTQRQALYDAFKQVRETGEAWVTWKDKRLKLRAVETQDSEGGTIITEPKPAGLLHDSQVFGRWWPGPYKAFVRCKGRGFGGIELAEIWWHEGRLHIQGGAFRRGNDDQVLAIVAEQHPRTEAEKP